MMRVSVPILALASISVLASSSSWASSNFPSEISSHLGGDTPVPSCTVCHASNAGGFGTVTKAHGIALMDAGLVAGDVASLHAALDALERNGTDSDGGGVGDVDELKAGTDPNVAGDDGSDGGGDGGGNTLQYGFCAAEPDQASGLGVGFALAAGLLLWRRRRR
jgi:MYXO-CTERM domain-containing protein